MALCVMQICIWPSWCHCHSLSLCSSKSRLVLSYSFYFSDAGSPGLSRTKSKRAVKRPCCVVSVTRQRRGAKSRRVLRARVAGGGVCCPCNCLVIYSMLLCWLFVDSGFMLGLTIGLAVGLSILIVAIILVVYLVVITKRRRRIRR